MRNIFLFSLLASFLIWSCESTNKNPDVSDAAAETIDEDTYQYESIPGSNSKRAFLRNAEGKLMEEGVLENGQRVGTWIFYNAEKKFPTKIISYVDGKYNGPYLEFNESGSITVTTFYVNNKLHGDWKKYRFGRIETSAQYAMGELDGLFVEYNFRDGKLKKEIYYKNGLQDGPMRFYDENETMTIEFMYKNGEKISGGSE